MKYVKQLFGQTLVYGMGTIVPRLMNYAILTPFYTYRLTPEQYGTFSYFYAWVSLLLVVLTFGMETAFFRFFNKEKSVEKVFGTSFISLLVLSLIFVFGTSFFCPEIANFTGYYGSADYILVLVVIVALDALMSIPYAKMRVENKALKFSVFKLINVVVTIGSVVFCIDYLPKMCNNLPHFLQDKVMVAFLSNLLGSGISLLLVSKEIFSLKMKFDFTLFKEMFKYSYPILIVGVFGFINENLEKILLKYLLPGNADYGVGVYSAAYKVAVLMILYTQMFRYAAEPFFFSIYKKLNSDAKQVYADVMKYFVICGLLLFMGVMFNIDVVKYFIGREFREGLFIVPIILISSLLLGMFYNLSVWYKLENKTIYGVYISFIGAIITLLVIFIFTPRVGYIAAAWAKLACYLSMTVLCYVFSRKYFFVNYDVKRLSLYFFIAIASYFLVFNLHFNKMIFGNILILIFLMIVYGLERKDLSGILKRK